MRVTNPSDLGAVVADERRRQELTQVELATRAGVSREWVVRFERGSVRAELNRVFQVLRALGLSVTLTEQDVPAADDTLDRLLADMTDTGEH